MRSPSNSRNRDDSIGNSESKTVLQCPLDVDKTTDELDALSNQLKNELTEEIQSPTLDAKTLLRKKYRRVFAILIAPYIILLHQSRFQF